MVPGDSSSFGGSAAVPKMVASEICSSRQAAIGRSKNSALALSVAAISGARSAQPDTTPPSITRPTLSATSTAPTTTAANTELGMRSRDACTASGPNMMLTMTAATIGAISDRAR